MALATNKTNTTATGVNDHAGIHNAMATLLNAMPVNAADPAIGLLPGNSAAVNKIALLAFIAAVDASTAGRGYIPAGTYSYDNTVEADITLTGLSNVLIEGAGRGITILQPSDNTKRALYLVSGTNLSLRDLTIGPSSMSGTRNANTLVEIALSTNVRVLDCEIKNASCILLAINGCGDAHVERCEVHHGKADGIHWVNCTQAFSCRGNHVHDIEDDGIPVWAYTDATSNAQYGGAVTDNVVENLAPGNGIICGGANGVTVTGNTVRNTTGCGIRVGKDLTVTTKGSRRITVTGNTVLNAFNAGVGGGYGAIEVSEYNGSGVRDYNVVNEAITVTGNVVVNSGNQSYEISSGTGVVFSNNVGVDANANNDAISACVTVQSILGLAMVGNVFYETRGSPLSSAGGVLVNLTDATIVGNAMRGMVNPNFQEFGTNTRCFIGLNDDDGGMWRIKAPLQLASIAQGISATGVTGSSVGDKVELYNDGGLSRYGLAVQPGALVAFMDAGSGFTVRQAAATGHASAGATDYHVLHALGYHTFGATVASASVPNSSLFPNSADSRMTWKDSSGGLTALEGRGFRAPVRVAAPVNVTVASPGATIDGVTMSAGPPKDRVLLANQTTASQNGLYDWNGAAVPMTRSADSDSAAKMTDSLLVTVDEGTVNRDSIFTLSTNKPITLGTTSLRFTRVHPGYAISSHPAGSAYQPVSSKLENMDRTQILLTSQPVLATGTVRVFSMGIVRAGDTLANINFKVGATASAAITNSWAGIARLSDRVVLAISATSTATTAINTKKTFTFGSAYAADKDETLVGFVMYQATTPPALFGAAHGDASIMAEVPIVNGTSNTGATTALSVGATLTAFTAQPQMYYAFCE